jgi:hypothetical protein
MRRPVITLLAVLLTGCTAGVATPSSGAPAHRPSMRPAHFLVGAAVTSITPPPFGTPHDPANCTGRVPDPADYTGVRHFAFEEPYIDQHGTGTFQPGDPYIDCNGNSRWDGILLGGGADSPRFATTVADPVTARALVVSNHSRTIAVEVLDQEGVFNVYQQRIRDRVAADGYHLDGIFISATHDESAPDTLGISGVDQTTSGTDAYYVDFLVARAARAIELAYAHRHPALIRYAEAIEPANLRQCFSSYPFIDDQLMPTLQAIGTDGRVIATLGDVSQHAETLGFNPDPAQRLWISSDWPNFFRTELEHRFGGIGIEMAGSVGSNETPEVFPGPISRVPQQFVDESHPAGCRTLFLANGTPAPVGYSLETTTLGQQLGRAVGDALIRSGNWSTSDALAGARTSVCITLTNALFKFGAALGVFAERPAYTDNCTVEIPPAANGATSGDELRTDVAAFRIGDGEFASVPGEAFPFTYLRGFVGPQDMPKPQFGMSPWLMPFMHTPYRFVDGLAEDMLGYLFPAGNGVGVIGEPNSDSDVDRFGCGHSDDSESTSSQAGNLVGLGLVSVLERIGGGSEPVVTGRYVLPGGTLSRNPQGQPDSIKCTVDTTFTPSGPAVAVWVVPRAAGEPATVVVPAAWMSLSGRRQRTPDRNTRGWIDRYGGRHWLDVFPDIPGAPARITASG